MDAVGIVGEYNPFHKGHEWHLAQTRRIAGEDCALICVMSGDFVQRGEAALYSKYARAEAACRCGVDLVIELPVPWSLSSAEGFAGGAVALMEALGCAGISFGSETGELEPLEQLAQTVIDPGIQAEIKILLDQDGSMSYAAARQKAVEARLGAETARLLEMPNNILAVEYLKAMYEQRSELYPIVIRRHGCGHDQPGGDGFLPAKEVRRLILSDKNAASYMPEAAAAVFAREDKLGRSRPDRSVLETAMLSRLRWLPEQAFEALPDGGDGLGRRLYRAAREEPTLDAVIAAAKSKRYALSRIRRLVCCAALGVTAEMTGSQPPYARVLAANAVGRAYLHEHAKHSKAPVVTKPASVKDLDSGSQRLFELGSRAHDLYVLGYPAAEDRRGGSDWRTGPVIL